MRFVPCELHTHTHHSDGEFTLAELARAARDEGLECIALTDHNTVSAWAEIDEVARKTGVAIIKGMELTTFFGHLTALGITRYVEWRDLGIDGLETALDRIHAAGGLAVIAHPFRPGNPFCTGCRFDFGIPSRGAIDAMEVWSEPFPGRVAYNERSTELWTSFANSGFRPTALYGRDWHRRGAGPGNVPVPGAAVSYVGVEEDERTMEDRVVEGIRRGRVAVSMGPTAVLYARCGRTGKTYTMGDEIPPEDASNPELIVDLDFSLRPGTWRLDEDALRVTVESRDGIIDEFQATGNAGRAALRVVRSVDASRAGWIRATLHGSISGYRGVIGFTNPIWC